MFIGGGSYILTGRKEGQMCLLVGDLIYLQVREKVGVCSLVGVTVTLPEISRVLAGLAASDT